METKDQSQHSDEPLVELVPEEEVLPALSQSAHPVEWIESNKEPEDEDS